MFSPQARAASASKELLGQVRCQNFEEILAGNNWNESVHNLQWSPSGNVTISRATEALMYPYLNPLYIMATLAQSTSSRYALNAILHFGLLKRTSAKLWDTPVPVVDS